MTHKKRTSTYEPATLKIIKRASGNYIMQFSIKELNNLVEWHKKHHLVRKWQLTKDETAIILM